MANQRSNFWQAFLAIIQGLGSIIARQNANPSPLFSEVREPSGSDRDPILGEHVKMRNEPRAATPPRGPPTPVKTWKSVKSTSMKVLRRSVGRSGAHALRLLMRKHNRRGVCWTTLTLRAIFSPSSHPLPDGFTKHVTFEVKVDLATADSRTQDSRFDQPLIYLPLH